MTGVQALLISDLIASFLTGRRRTELTNASTTGLPLIAGPVEATALGNVLVQARAAVAVSGALPELRRMVGAEASLRRYELGGAGFGAVEC